MRWSIQIQEFNLQIKHIAGKDDVGADTLTRYHQNEQDRARTIQQIFINQLITKQYSRELIQQFKLQQQDKKIGSIKQR